MRTTWSEQQSTSTVRGLSEALRAEEFATLPCRQVDPEVFFAESPTDVEWAKALCGPCPLREQCLQGALERREPWGVWGGQLFINGVVVARKRPRGRPRKNPLPEHLPRRGRPAAPADVGGQRGTGRAA